MTAASRSVYYFGFYLLATGVTLTVFPNVLLSMLGFQETTEVWIRIIGILVFSIGLYYILMAATNNTLFVTITVYIRISVFVWFLAFVLVGLAPVQLILFGVVDLAGAIWTYLGLRK